MPRLFSEHGVKIGWGSPGASNCITDIDGVQVSHATVIEGDQVLTGVTAIIPHFGNVFYKKVQGAAVAISGFGKAIGFTRVRGNVTSGCSALKIWLLGEEDSNPH